MSYKRLIRPAEVRANTKLDHVALYPNEYIWIMARPHDTKYATKTTGSVQIEMTLLDGNLIIHCPPEFAEHIQVVPYDECGNATGMEDVEVKS